MRQCICQICICGRHRCEHTAKRRVPYAKDDDIGVQTTEHKERYRPFGFQPRQQPIKPPSGPKWKGDEPTVKLSTTKRDFVPLPLQKRSLIRPKHTAAPKGKYEDINTTYKHDYVPKRAIRTQKTKIPDPEGKDGIMPGTLPGKMEGASTYNRSYTPKPFQKRDKLEAKECTLTELGQPFSGEAETARSYVPHPYQKREGILPNIGTLKPEGEFLDATTHQTDFTPKYVKPERVTAKKKMGKWKPGEGKFESDTTHKVDFKCPASTEKAISCAPKPAMAKSLGPFQGRSHYKQDFVPHQISQRDVPKWHPSYLTYKPSGKPFEGETTYRTDYEPPPDDLAQYESTKPLKSTLTIPSGPMEKMTTFMRDFTEKSCPVPTKSFKPDQKYQKPKEKFAGCTVHKTDYTPKHSEKQEMVTKGSDNLKPGKGLMENTSMTRKDFQWLAIECPATYIKLFGKDALPNYKFEKREGGHDYFKKLTKDNAIVRNLGTKREITKKVRKVQQK